MDKAFSHAIAHMSEPAHAQETIWVPGKVTHTHSQPAKDSATR